MFNTMVKNICMCAVEIWGIEERKEIKSIHERYLKNILGLGRCKPGYLVREETITEMDKEKWTETRLRKVREDLYKKAGMSRWEAEGKDDKGENVVELWRNGVLEAKRRERERRLEESAYNEEYIRWRMESMPRYLEEKKGTETKDNNKISTRK